jgi:hypothetical protein
MKKNVLILVMSIFFVVVINAQSFIGGDVSFSTSSSSTKIGSTTTDNGSTSIFELKPLIGFYVSDGFALGAEVLMSVETETTPNNSANGDDKNTTTLYGIGPFVRFHLLEYDKFKIYTQAQLGLAFGTNKDKPAGSSTTTEMDIFALRIKAFPGIAYEVTENFDLELSFGNLEYSSLSIKRDDYEKNSSDFKLYLSSGLSLGFLYKF